MACSLPMPGCRRSSSRSARWRSSARCWLIIRARSRLPPLLPVWMIELPRTNLFSLGGFDVRITFGIAVAVVIAVHLALDAPARRAAVLCRRLQSRCCGDGGHRHGAAVFTAFVLCGALAGFAGFMFLSRFGNITVVAGLGFELKSVAAVVVGGVNIFGGSGSVVGTLLGAILVDPDRDQPGALQIVSEFGARPFSASSSCCRSRPIRS